MTSLVFTSCSFFARAGAAVCVLIAFLSLSIVATAQPSTLTPSRPVEQALKVGDTAEFVIKLKRGQFVRIEAHPKNIDIVLTLLTEDGKTVVKRDVDTNYLWRESLSVITEAGGSYKLQIKGVGPIAYVGGFSVSVPELRKPVVTDLKRIEAEGEMVRAISLGKENKFTESSVAFETAARLWREFGDSYWEAVSNWNLAWAYHSLKRNEEALKLHQQALGAFQKIGDGVGEAAAMGAMGVIQASTENKNLAKELLEKSLVIIRELGRSRNEFNRLNVLVGVYFDLKQTDKVIESLQRMLAISQERKARDDERETLNRLALFTRLNDDYLGAQKYLTAALVIDKELNDVAGQLERLDGLANNAAIQQRYEEALNTLQQAVELAQKSNDGKHESKALSNLGYFHVVPLHNCGRARGFLERALDIGTKAKIDKPAETDLLTRLTHVSVCLGDNQKTIEYAQQGLKLAEDANALNLIISFQQQLGIGYQNTGQLLKAKESFEKAILMAQKGKYKLLEGTSLLALADFYSFQDYQKKKEAEEKAVQIARTLKDDRLLNFALNVLATSYSYLNQYELAEKSFEELLVSARRANNKNAEVRSLHGLGLLFARQGHSDKAHAYFKKALELAQETSQLAYSAYIESSIGNLYLRNSQFEEAIRIFEKALSWAQTENDLNWQTALQGSLGNAYSAINEHEKAFDHFQQSLDKARASKNRISEAIAFIGLGNVQFKLNQYQKALESFKQVEEIALETNSKWLLGFATVGFGFIDTDLFQNQRARSNYEQSLGLMKNVLDRTSEGSVLNAIGNLYLNIKDYDAACRYYEQSLAVAREVKNKRGEVYPLVNLGIAFQKKGQFERALESLNNGLSLAREVKDLANEGFALRGLGEVSVSLKKFTEAEVYFRQSLIIAREVQSKKLEGSVLQDLMDLFKEIKRPQLSILYGKQAVNAYQETRRNIRSFDRESQQSFVKEKEPAYRSLAGILISQGRLLEAQTVLDLLKEEEFSALVRRGLSGDSVGFSSEEAKAIESLNSLAEIGRIYDELFTKSKAGLLNNEEWARLKQLKANLEVANRESQAAIAALAARVKGGEGAVAASAADAFRSDLRELGAGTVALYTVIEKGDNGVTTNGWIVLVTPGFHRAYPIDVTKLDQTVFAFRDALSRDTYDPQPIAKRLYQMLFLQGAGKGKTTLARDLEIYLRGQKNKTLMWSLDGVLRYLPVAALHDGQRYLVESYRNVLFNTASKPRLKDSLNPRWTALGLGVSEGREEAGLTFKPLPGSQTELTRIVKENDSSIGVLPGVVMVNKAFTREAMTEALLRYNYPVVHISSHFRFQSTDFEQSFLLLGQGRWTVKEMKTETTLFYQVDLVTLSACDTAIGKANGKEAEGFAYLAQSLGAKAVIASLWPVDDIGTQVLMPEFYRLRETRMSKAEALQRAQIALLKGEFKESTGDSRSPQSSQRPIQEMEGFMLTPYKTDPERPFAHPYYWAPFVLIGNWK